MFELIFSVSVPSNICIIDVDILEISVASIMYGDIEELEGICEDALSNKAAGVSWFLL